MMNKQKLLKILENLYIKTNELYNTQPCISPKQGEFLSFLLKTISPKNCLEIGTYTGYSTLWIASSISKGAKLITIDKRNLLEFSKSFWEEADVFSKIEFKHGDANVLLDELEKDYFEFIFIE